MSGRYAFNVWEAKEILDKARGEERDQEAPGIKKEKGGKGKGKHERDAEEVLSEEAWKITRDARCTLRIAYRNLSKKDEEESDRLADPKKVFERVQEKWPGDPLFLSVLQARVNNICEEMTFNQREFRRQTYENRHAQCQKITSAWPYWNGKEDIDAFRTRVERELKIFMDVAKEER
jgi:hypothetical protein